MLDFGKPRILCEARAMPGFDMHPALRNAMMETHKTWDVVTGSKESSNSRARESSLSSVPVTREQREAMKVTNKIAWDSMPSAPVEAGGGSVSPPDTARGALMRPATRDAIMQTHKTWDATEKEGRRKAKEDIRTMRSAGYNEYEIKVKMHNENAAVAGGRRVAVK